MFFVVAHNHLDLHRVYLAGLYVADVDECTCKVALRTFNHCRLSVPENRHAICRSVDAHD